MKDSSWNPEVTHIIITAFDIVNPHNSNWGSWRCKCGEVFYHRGDMDETINELKRHYARTSDANR